MASKPVNLSESSELVKKMLPKMVYEFYVGGAEEEWTLEQNITAF